MGALEELKKKYPGGIPVKDPEKVAELVAKAADHLDPEDLRDDLQALQDATDAKDTQKQILTIIAMLTKAGLEIAIPG